MASEREFRVDLEALACSAVHVGGQGEDLALAHVASDDRMQAAQPGWVGFSAAALSATTAAWLVTARTLLTGVGDYALGLNNDTIEFAAMERENRENVEGLIGDVDGGRY
jgi:hypothetical protein